MKFICLYWPMLLSVLLITGCGIQMPVTEGLVFSSSEPYGQRHEEILPFLRYGGAVTAISILPLYSPLQAAAVDREGSSQAQYLNRRYMAAGGNAGFGVSPGSGRRIAVGFTPGLVVTGMHADATVRTFEQVFFTVNFQLGLQSGTEFILQRPVWEKSGGGISMGAFFRNQPMQFVENDEQWSWGEPGFQVPWYGLRLMGQTPKLLHTRLHIRGFVNAGYTGKYGAPLVGMGMVFAFD